MTASAHAAHRRHAAHHHHLVVYHSHYHAAYHRHSVADRRHRIVHHGHPLRYATGNPQSGIASVYGGSDGYCGKRVAIGGVLHCRALTAAHRTLPFGTLVRVTNDRTGRSVVVRINDRGPFVRGRVIDVTPAAAHALGFSGLAYVTLTVVGRS